MSQQLIELGLMELCDLLQIEELQCVELVECGVVEVAGPTASDWVFDAQAQIRISRAVRLHRDLEIAFSDIAIVLSLLEERDRLQTENMSLKRRLSRFIREERD
jgi:chaperone modulatory protein CbpM